MAFASGALRDLLMAFQVAVSGVVKSLCISSTLVECSERNGVTAVGAVIVLPIRIRFSGWIRGLVSSRYSACLGSMW